MDAKDRPCASRARCATSAYRNRRSTWNARSTSLTPPIPHRRAVKISRDVFPISGDKIGRNTAVMPFEHEMANILRETIFENAQFATFDVHFHERWFLAKRV